MSAPRKRRSLLGTREPGDGGTPAPVGPREHGAPYGASDVPAPDATPAPAAPRQLGEAPPWGARPAPWGPEAPPPLDSVPPPAVEDLDPFNEPSTEPMQALDERDVDESFAHVEPGETIVPGTINDEEDQEDGAGAGDPGYSGGRFGGVVYEEVGRGTPPPPPAPGYSLGDDAHQVAEVPYVGAGTAKSFDSTDLGWGSIPMMRSPMAKQPPPPDDEYPATAPFVPSPDRYKIKQQTGDIWRAGATREPTPPPARGRTPGGARPRRGKPFARTGDPFEDSPPTEEIPIGGMMADMSTSIGGPVSMPELPSVFDKLEAPQAAKADPGRAAARPSYLVDEPVATPAPQPARQAAKPKEKPAAAAEPPAEERGMGMTIVALGAAAIALLSVVVILGVGAMMMLTADKQATASADMPAPVAPAAVPTRRGSQVPVRGDMKTAPAAPEIPEEIPAEVVAAEGDLAAPAPAPVAPAPAPVAPAPAPVAAPAPAPAAAPAPRPAPPPKPAVAESSTGTLKIKSNRRVLVYVNGAPVGYAPTDYKGKPGAYTISAMVPGQPDTKQTKDARIDAAGANATVNFTF